MPAHVLFADSDAAADALTFAGRTARLGDGAVRLQASAGTMAMTSAPLAPRGLLDPTPTVLALRALPVDPELECDLVVDAASLRASQRTDAAVDLPDSALSAAWAGISPPRRGWTALPPIDTATIAARAQWGITAVAEAMPADPGEDVVHTVRASVWGEPDALLDGLPRGAAFAAFAMGFIVGQEDARVLTSGAWTRVTLLRGHVLVRRPVRSGLTAVRRTGVRDV
jgi:hypothetical protein